jgi:hypothetical protein
MAWGTTTYPNPSSSYTNGGNAALKTWTSMATVAVDVELKPLKKVGNKLKRWLHTHRHTR